MAKIRWIRKRDSRQAPFDPTKIADAIFAAARAVGEEDRALAGELAEAVTVFLETRYEDKVPGIEEIQDMVERVLIETGHARMAKSYILYRDQRARVRETLRVRREIERGAYQVTDDLQVSPGGEARAEGWSKGKIAAALVLEAGLDATAAAEIARAVEKKVFASGVRTTSTKLIRGLVDNELFERGLEAPLRRQTQVGIPKYDLEGILMDGQKDVAGLSARIGNRILRDFALEEVYSRDVTAAHRNGSLYIHGLDAPLSFLEAHLAPAGGRLGDGGPGKQQIAELLVAMDSVVSRAIHILGYGAAGIGTDLFDPTPVTAWLRGGWLQRPEGGLKLHILISRLEESGPEAIRSILGAPDRVGLEVEIILHAGEDESAAESALRVAAEEIAGGRNLSFSWGPGPTNGYLLANEISLNLPRAARNAGSGNFTTFLEASHSMISLAYQGLRQAHEFRSRMRGGSGTPHAETGSGEVYHLSPIGLADAIRGLTGADPAQGGRSWETHLEALKSLRSAVEDLSELGGPKVRLGASSPQPAASRFARIDLSTRQGYSRPSPSPAYANGFHLGPDIQIPLADRISREKEIARTAGFGAFVVPRFTDGPPSLEEITDLLRRSKGYPGPVTVPRVFHPIAED